MSQSLLVTGGETAHGQLLVGKLVERGNTVHALFSSPKLVPMGLLGKINLKFCFVELDHDTHIDKSLPRMVDVVYHCHEAESVGKSNSRVFGGNTFSTMQLLDWAKKIGVKEFILGSTGAVYGGGESALVETDRPRPLTFGTSTKYMAEMLSGFYQRSFNVKIARLFPGYGPKVTSGVIYDLAARVREEVEFNVPYARVTPVYVDDAAEILRQLPEVDGSMIINVCGPEVVDLPTVAERIGAQLAKIPRLKGESRPSLIGSNQKLVEVLHYEFKTSFDEGLERMLAEE